MSASRRDFLRSSSALVSASVAGSAGGGDTIAIDPKPLFDISPYLYMQFMEPLGTTDSSVEGAWDYDRADWRADLVEAVQSALGPGPALRWTFPEAAVSAVELELEAS